MTVSFIDIPGPLSNTREPIDFTTTSLVTSISVEFNPATGSGSRETVWDGSAGDGTGDFSYAYRNSTRTGAGPYTWTVRRTTPWPAEFRIRVQETTPAFSTAWQTLGDFDFTAFPTGTDHTAGAGGYTVSLGGYTWNASDTLGGSPGQQQVLGSGYRLRSNGRTWASGSSQTGSYLCLNLALLPGHNAAKKQAVLAVFDGAFTSTGERAAVGHWAPLGGSGGSQSVLALSQVAGGLRWTAPTLRPCFYGPSVVDFAPADGVYSAVAASANFTFGAVRASDSHGYGVFAPYSGTLPRVEDARVIMGADSAYAAGGLYGGVGWAANSGVRNCIVKRIQFLQER